MSRASLEDKNYHMRRRFDPSVLDFCSRCEGRVLDLGCGDKPFQKYLTNTEYVGFDRSALFADVQGDALSLPFADSNFDHVLSTQVLEHVPNPFKFVSEIGRVLKDGGSALITTNMMWNLHVGPDDYFRFTRFGLRHLAQEADLSPKDDIEIGTIPMRLCQKVNDAYTYVLPQTITAVMTVLTNLLFYPLIDIDTHQDYILVGIEVKK